ncbi:MAG: cytochrome c oxidase assembly protein [Woeseia sp.]
MTDKGKDRSNDPASLARRLLLFAVGMFAFGYALVPLYDVFCEVTGFGGRTNEQPAMAAEEAETGRTINLEFVTTVNEYAPWEFRSEVEKMRVHPGGLYEANFVARNRADRQMTARAVPSVAPQQAARYFRKLDCFCFTAQEFAPQETRQLSVRFIIDSELPEYVDTITLSYTFFDTAAVSGNRAAPQTSANAHTSSTPGKFHDQY